MYVKSCSNIANNRLPIYWSFQETHIYTLYLTSNVGQLACKTVSRADGNLCHVEQPKMVVQPNKNSKIINKIIPQLYRKTYWSIYVQAKNRYNILRSYGQ